LCKTKDCAKKVCCFNSEHTPTTRTTYEQKNTVSEINKKGRWPKNNDNNNNNT